MPFGGKLIVFGGDFRIILLVVKKGSRADIVAASLSRSHFLPDCHGMHLKINMRLRDLNLSNHEYECLRHFGDSLWIIGDGRFQGISLQSEVYPNSKGLSKLILKIYTDLSVRYNDLTCENIAYWLLQIMMLIN